MQSINEAFKAGKVKNYGVTRYSKERDNNSKNKSQINIDLLQINRVKVKYILL